VIPIRSILDAQLAHRKLRCEGGLNQTQLAAKLHISEGQVYTREGGKSGFGIEALVALGAAFGYDLVLLPRRAGAGDCCDHCRQVAQLVDERRAIRLRHSDVPTPFSRLYDAIAKATGRAA